MAVVPQGRRRSRYLVPAPAGAAGIGDAAAAGELGQTPAHLRDAALRRGLSTSRRDAGREHRWPNSGELALAWLPELRDSD